MKQVLVYGGSRSGDVTRGFLGLAALAGGLGFGIYSLTSVTGDDQGGQILIACGIAAFGIYLATISFSAAAEETRDPVLVLDAEGICVDGRCVPWHQVERIQVARIAPNMESSTSVYQLRVSCRGAPSPLERSRFPEQPHQPPLPKVLAWIGGLTRFGKQPKTDSGRDKMWLFLEGLPMHRDQIIKAIGTYYGGTIENTRARSLKN